MAFSNGFRRKDVRVFLLISINLDVLIYYSAMKSTLKTLKLLADPTRLRIINVLNEESLSVAELQEILGMGKAASPPSWPSSGRKGWWRTPVPAKMSFTLFPWQAICTT